MSILLNRFVPVLLCAGLAACAAPSLLSDQDAIDYKSSQSSVKLEIPPDLTQLKPNDRFVQKGSVTATQVATVNSNTVLPASAVAKIERSGGQRWLVVDMPAEKVYPVIIDFWKQLGFTLAIESPQTGIIETDWAENRAKLPAEGFRKILGGIFDGMYDSGQRDKYRTRIERNGNSTEIYLTHRGTTEYNASSNNKEPDIKTVLRNGDSQLEGEFLRRLLLRFGVDETTAKAAVSPNAPIIERARIKGQTLEIDGSYDDVWRRVGVALDRTGFTVEDRNYSEGVYYVKYARSVNDDDLGFFKRIFTSEKDKLQASQKLQVVVKKAPLPVVVTVNQEKGGQVASDIAQNVIKVLHEELR